MDSDDELFSAKVIEGNKNSEESKNYEETQSEQMYIKQPHDHNQINE